MKNFLSMVRDLMEDINLVDANQVSLLHDVSIEKLEEIKKAINENPNIGEARLFGDLEELLQAYHFTEPEILRKHGYFREMLIQANDDDLAAYYEGRVNLLHELHYTFEDAIVSTTKLALTYFPDKIIEPDFIDLLRKHKIDFVEIKGEVNESSDTTPGLEYYFKNTEAGKKLVPILQRDRRNRRAKDYFILLHALKNCGLIEKQKFVSKFPDAEMISALNKTFRKYSQTAYYNLQSGTADYRHEIELETNFVKSLIKNHLQ
jgi:hypothetical protein